jgi:hypothetical protein
MTRRPTPVTIAAVRESCRRAGVDASDAHVIAHARWRERHEREQRSIDRLTARVVWAHLTLVPLARAWRSLAIAGPRGVLP